MAIRNASLALGLIAATAATPVLADTLSNHTSRYRVGVGFGPGESLSGGDLNYRKFTQGAASAEIQISINPVPAINAAASNSDAGTDIFAFGFLGYDYAVDFTAASGLVINDLNIVDVTGLAYLETTLGGSIFANAGDGLVSWTCTDGAGDCGTFNFAVTDNANSYIETDQLDGTSIYTLSGFFSLTGSVNAAANLLNDPGYLAMARLYLDPTIGLNTAFATTNNVSNIVVQLSPGVMNASGPVVPLAPGVPEPASWALLIAGFGLVGAMQRRRQRVVA